jgi:hypothetical protein
MPHPTDLKCPYFSPEFSTMKRIVFVLAGIAAAAACVLITRSRSPRSIDDLAHNLQDAWADHHTVA